MKSPSYGTPRITAADSEKSVENGIFIKVAGPIKGPVFCGAGTPIFAMTYSGVFKQYV